MLYAAAYHLAKMVDPYGDDHEDLSVTSYVEDCLHITNIVRTSVGSDQRFASYAQDRA